MACAAAPSGDSKRTRGLGVMSAGRLHVRAWSFPRRLFHQYQFMSLLPSALSCPPGRSAAAPAPYERGWKRFAAVRRCDDPHLWPPLIGTFVIYAASGARRLRRKVPTSRDLAAPRGLDSCSDGQDTRTQSATPGHSSFVLTCHETVPGRAKALGRGEACPWTDGRTRECPAASRVEEVRARGSARR